MPCNPVQITPSHGRDRSSSPERREDPRCFSRGAVTHRHTWPPSSSTALPKPQGMEKVCQVSLSSSSSMLGSQSSPPSPKEGRREPCSLFVYKKNGCILITARQEEQEREGRRDRCREANSISSLSYLETRYTQTITCFERFEAAKEE